MGEGTTKAGARVRDEFLEGLVSDLAPVRPVRLAVAVAWAFALEVLVVLAAGWATGLPTKGFARLADPIYAAFVVALAIGAGASAVATAMLAIPGRVVGAAWRTAVVFLPLILAATVIVLSPWGGTWKGFGTVLVEGLPCIAHTMEIALPGWIAGLLLLRRLGPLDPMRVGLFAGTSSLLTSAVVIQLACPSCDSWHLALTHYVPVLLAAWVAGLLSAFVLSRPIERPL